MCSCPDRKSPVVLTLDGACTVGHVVDKAAAVWAVPNHNGSAIDDDRRLFLYLKGASEPLPYDMVLSAAEPMLASGDTVVLVRGRAPP